jgi:hypothetical protein
VLVQTHQNLLVSLDSVYFTEVAVRGVNIGGYVCSVVTARRTERVFVESFSPELNDEQPVRAVSAVCVVGKKRAIEDQEDDHH